MLATLAIPALLVLRLVQTPAASPWAYVLIAIGAGMACGSSVMAMEPGRSPEDERAAPP